MKNFRSLTFFLALLLVLGGTTTLSAEIDPLLVRTSTEAKTLRVVLANLEQETTRTTFASLKSGQLLWQSVTRKHNGDNKLLNLETLPQGRYVLTVTKGKSQTRQVVVITADGIKLSEQSVTE